MRPLGTFILSALGMWFGHWLGTRSDSLLPEAHALAERPSEVVAAREIQIVDSQGRRQILLSLGTKDGAPGIWFFDQRGKVRLGLGLYEDDNAYVVLNDASEQAVQIFRTVGPKSDPYFIMKAGGQDRIIMGLHGPGSDPFFVHYNASGAKTTVFGDY